MIYNIMLFIVFISAVASLALLIMWAIKKITHTPKWGWIKWWHFIAAFVIMFVFTMIAPSTETQAQKAADRKEAISESRDKAKQQSESESKRKSSESRRNSIKAVESSKIVESKKNAAKAKSSSNKAKRVRESKAESISRAKKVTESNKQKKQKKAKVKKNTTKPSNASRYKSISLNKFTDNPIKYDGVNIKTSGIVTYIQKNPDDKNIYYVVIAPRDKYTSSGYSDGHGSVTEVNIDTMHDTPVHEGDYITVKGGGLSGTVQLNGKTLKSDIVVDSLTVH
ncbi:hypothetical protein [Levilactobacillus brevis]|uniref:hypothetical protein n=1 Tax=Levilactobacillus brevis TaxID=1580 RepID=UPI0021C93C71|nr:hypothetical protein [Levilactobacillus brevis]MCU0199905.1 hypothetical protein [Levilactobacillus brevis]